MFLSCWQSGGQGCFLVHGKKEVVKICLGWENGFAFYNL